MTRLRLLGAYVLAVLLIGAARVHAEGGEGALEPYRFKQRSAMRSALSSTQRRASQSNVDYGGEVQTGADALSPDYQGSGKAKHYARVVPRSEIREASGCASCVYSSSSSHSQSSHATDRTSFEIVSKQDASHTVHPRVVRSTLYGVNPLTGSARLQDPQTMVTAVTDLGAPKKIPLNSPSEVGATRVSYMNRCNIYTADKPVTCFLEEAAMLRESSEMLTMKCDNQDLCRPLSGPLMPVTARTVDPEVKNLEVTPITVPRGQLPQPSQPGLPVIEHPGDRAATAEAVKYFKATGKYPWTPQEDKPATAGPIPAQPQAAPAAPAPQSTSQPQQQQQAVLKALDQFNVDDINLDLSDI